jgi:hypothetical protein
MISNHPADLTRPRDSSKRWALALILIAMALFALDTARLQIGGPDHVRDLTLP